MDDLLRAIDKYENGTVLIYEFEDGGIMIGATDTIFESDNGLDYDEEGYEEYYAAVVNIMHVEKYTNTTKDMKGGHLIEICYKSLISKIKLQDGTLIWSKC